MIKWNNTSDVGIVGEAYPGVQWGHRILFPAHRYTPTYDAVDNAGVIARQYVLLHTVLSNPSKKTGTNRRRG
jgi:hypothetical protein